MRSKVDHGPIAVGDCLLINENIFSSRADRKSVPPCDGEKNTPFVDEQLLIQKPVLDVAIFAPATRRKSLQMSGLEVLAREPLTTCATLTAGVWYIILIGPRRVT